MDKTDENLLLTIADLHGVPQGAYNIRKNGAALMRSSSEHIEIIPKRDKPGIDIIVKPFTKNESVHIPVILTETGLDDLVYNDFYIGEGADVLIVAGCGIHNSGNKKSEHDGIHCFHIGKNARVKYVEKHYGEGDGTGERILNPRTEVYMDENSYCEMEMVQIKGVDSTKRETLAQLKSGAKIVIFERLMTHGAQTADSDIVIELNGEDSSAQIVSRSVAKNTSRQKFFPRAHSVRLHNYGRRAHCFNTCYRSERQRSQHNSRSGNRAHKQRPAFKASDARQNKRRGGRNYHQLLP